jgi:hypothetical protein
MVIPRRLKELKLLEQQFSEFHDQLAAHGYVAKAGRVTGASFVEASRQRNNLEENATIKAGLEPLWWGQTPNKLRLQYTDAC